jgi:peptidoglycan/LPS O-acetylase OafA/YrhL
MQSVNLKGRFLFLDGLRGIAAIAVVLFHFFNHWVSPVHDALARMLPDSIQSVLEHADLGVEVFFVLSGFVIAHSVFDKPITLQFAGKFILRRSLRLDPPYWVVIAINLLLPYLLFATLRENLFLKFGGTSGLLVNMFYLPDLLWQPRIVGVAWTLCLEVQFYLVFMLLLGIAHAIGVVLPRHFHWISKAVARVLFAALLAYSVHRWISAGKNDFGGRWFMFFTGALLYWTLRGRVNLWIFGIYLIVILGLSIRFREIRSMMVLVTALVIYGSALCGGLQSWFGSRPFRYLGRISYSLYLVHMTVGVATMVLVLRFLNDSNAAVIVALSAAIIVSVLSADLLNRFVEVPAMQISHYFKRTEHPITQEIHVKPSRRIRYNADVKLAIGIETPQLT